MARRQKNKHLSEQELILLLRGSDHSAFTEIYDRYFRLMFLFAFKKLSDEDLAKDLVQDLFINLWNKRDILQEEGNLTAFLYTLLRNQILNSITREKVKQKYIDSFRNYYDTTFSVATDHLIRERQLQDYIDKQIAALPKKMKQIFLLSRTTNLSYKEIAERLAISEKTVNSQIVNALTRLRMKLGVLIILIGLVISLPKLFDFHQLNPGSYGLNQRIEMSSQVNSHNFK